LERIVSDLTQARLKELLHYDPETGLFRWLVKFSRQQPDGAAGTKDAYGYLLIRVERRLYKAHRLAWLYVHGAWPTKGIDHINRVRDDNRIANLREACQSLNTMNQGARANSRSGVTGVVWKEDRQKWYAQIRIGYRMVHLGVFKNKNDAAAARKKAEDAFFSGYATGVCGK
jgi:hypothetical protein